MILFACLAALSSCGSSKKVIYFQDLKPGESEIRLPDAMAITIRLEDKISIVVNSRDPQLTDLFNLPIMSRQLGQSMRSSGSSVGASQGVSAYTVDANGEIDFPVLGKIRVAGMKREEIATKCWYSGRKETCNVFMDWISLRVSMCIHPRLITCNRMMWSMWNPTP